MIKNLIFLSLLLIDVQAHAWARRGHAIIGSAAAYVLEKDFLKEHSFDMSYYSNVPDFIWKEEEHYTVERVEHFFDKEIFDRTLGADAVYNSNRMEFFTKNKIPRSAGRAPWRIYELNEDLTRITKDLQDGTKSPKDHQALQLEWLVRAGTLGHYVEDLSMPLHVAENYDGVMTGQKGIHGFYEEMIVDELWPQVEVDVQKQVKKKWPAFHKNKKSVAVFDLLFQEIKESILSKDTLLALDKKWGRADLKKVAPAYKKLLTDNLTLGTLYLAEIWSRQLDWNYDKKNFYLFRGRPEYIPSSSEPELMKK